MTKAEKFIQDYTNHCSNELEGGGYHEWLTPEQARAAVWIARVEMLKDEPVSEELEEAAYQYANCFKEQFEMASMAFIKGAKWQKEQLMKDALPLATKEGDKYKVVLVKED